MFYYPVKPHSGTGDAPPTAFKMTIFLG